MSVSWQVLVIKRRFPKVLILSARASAATTALVSSYFIIMFDGGFVPFHVSLYQKILFFNFSREFFSVWDRGERQKQLLFSIRLCFVVFVAFVFLFYVIFLLNQDNFHGLQLLHFGLETGMFTRDSSAWKRNPRLRTHFQIW